MQLPSSSEASGAVRDGNVLYLGVSSLEQVPDEISEGISGELDTLLEHHSHNSDVLFSSGIAGKVLDIERTARFEHLDFNNWTEEGFEMVSELLSARDADVFDIDPAVILLEDMEGPLRVDEGTQFLPAQDAENIYGGEKPALSLPGSMLYVVVHNIADSDIDMDIRTHKVGSRIKEDGGGYSYSAIIPEIPDELRLEEGEVEQIDQLLERMRTDDSLPHLEKSGRFDTLVVNVPKV